MEFMIMILTINGFREKKFGENNYRILKSSRRPSQTIIEWY